MKYHIVKTTSKETKREVWSAHHVNLDGSIGEYVCGTTTPKGEDVCKEMLDAVLEIPQPEIVRTVEI